MHRDIKPANIMLDEAGNPLLTDLGLAKNTANESNLTQTGVLVGTPSYMPPEQADSVSTLTTAADIYSTGAILYELLTGQPPYAGTSPVETILRVLNDPIKPPRSLNKSIEPDLELICMKCLERAPQARYSSAASLAADLRNWLEGEPISVKPPTLFALISTRMRRNQGLVYAILVALTGSVLSLYLSKNVTYPINSRFSLKWNDGSFGSMHTGGCQFTRADGSVQFVPESIDMAIYRAVASRNGGEPAAITE